jgi:hypothetical protein
MKKFAFAAFFTIAMTSFALAEEFIVVITKVDADKGTITYKKGFKKQQEDTPVEAVTVSVSKKVKIAKGEMKKDDAGDKKFTFTVGEEIKDGFKDDAFTKADEKGTFAQITIADTGDDKGKVTQILIMKGFGGKKKGGN